MGLGISSSKIRTLSLILFLAAIFLSAFHELAYSDTFYDLKTGEIMLSTGSIPHADTYLYTAQGNPWITHEWLSQVIFYSVYHLSGFWGLIVFVCLLAMLTYYTLLKIAEHHGANRSVAICVFLLAGIGGMSFWIARPQAVTFLLLSLLLYCLDAFGRVGKKKYLALTCGIIWLWANVSASVVLGILILGLFAAMALVKFLKNRSTSFFYFAITLMVATGLSFVNPNSWRVLTYSLAVAPAIKAFHVYEWEPITNFLQFGEIDLYVAEIFVFAAFLIFTLGLRKKSPDLNWVFLLIAVSIMPFISSRHLIIWSLVVLPPLAWSISRFKASKIPPVAAISLSIVFIGIRFVGLPAFPVNKGVLPVEAADFLRENDARGNLFNTYDDGDYLIWRLWPAMGIFIDGRSEVIAGTPLNDYLTIVGNGSSTDYLVNQKYKIEYFVLPGYRNKLEPIFPLIQRLLGQGWLVVFWNDTSIIMARNDAANAGIIERYALKYVGPFTLPETIPQSDAIAAEQELKELIARFPDSISLGGYRQSFEAAHMLPR